MKSIGSFLLLEFLALTMLHSICLEVGRLLKGECDKTAGYA
jgi:hypothetical protein